MYSFFVVGAFEDGGGRGKGKDERQEREEGKGGRKGRDKHCLVLVRNSRRSRLTNRLEARRWQYE
jgi:hypothetical protein